MPIREVIKAISADPLPFSFDASVIEANPPIAVSIDRGSNYCKPLELAEIIDAGQMSTPVVAMHF